MRQPPDGIRKRRATANIVYVVRTGCCCLNSTRFAFHRNWKLWSVPWLVEPGMEVGMWVPSLEEDELEEDELEV